MSHIWEMVVSDEVEINRYYANQTSPFPPDVANNLYYILSLLAFLDLSIIDLSLHRHVVNQQNVTLPGFCRLSLALN